MKKFFERLIKQPSPNVPDTPLASLAESPFTAVPAPQPEEEPQLSPRHSLNNYIAVILDSCRCDTLMAAAPKMGFLSIWMIC